MEDTIKLIRFLTITSVGSKYYSLITDDDITFIYNYFLTLYPDPEQLPTVLRATIFNILDRLILATWDKYNVKGKVEEKSSKLSRSVDISSESNPFEKIKEDLLNYPERIDPSFKGVTTPVIVIGGVITADVRSINDNPNLIKGGWEINKLKTEAGRYVPSSWDEVTFYAGY